MRGLTYRFHPGALLWSLEELHDDQAQGPGGRPVVGIREIDAFAYRVDPILDQGG